MYDTNEAAVGTALSPKVELPPYAADDNVESTVEWLPETFAFAVASCSKVSSGKREGDVTKWQDLAYPALPVQF